MDFGGIEHVTEPLRGITSGLSRQLTSYTVENVTVEQHF